MVKIDKSYGQNKIKSEIMAISFAFFQCPKLTTLEEALPMGPHRSSLCLCFWNPWNMYNGKHTQTEIILLSSLPVGQSS